MLKSPERRSAHLAADVPRDMHAAVVAMAKQHGVSASTVLRWALTAYVPALRDGPVAPTRRVS